MFAEQVKIVCHSSCMTSAILNFFVPCHTFMEIPYEIISRVILLSSAESFKKDCCQLHVQAKVCALSTNVLVNCMFKLAQEKSVIR